MEVFTYPFKYYSPTIFVANIVSIVYFFLNILLFPLLNPLHFPYGYLTISLIGLIASALCFGDFYLWESTIFQDYEITEEERARDIKTGFYSVSLLYLSANVSVSVFSFLLLVVDNVSSLSTKQFINLIVIGFVLIVIALIGLFIAIGTNFVGLFSDIKRFKNKTTLMSPLPFIMVAGGEDIVNYLIIIIWVVSIVQLVRKSSLKKLSFKRFSELKNNLTQDLMKTFRTPFDAKTRFVLDFPVMLFLFVFLTSAASRMDLLYTTVTIVILLFAYIFPKIENKKLQKPKWMLAVIILFSSLSFYFHYLNVSIYQFGEPVKEYILFNYKIDFETLVIFAIGVGFFFYFVTINILKLKTKTNQLYRLISYIFTVESLTYVIPIILLLFSPLLGVLNTIFKILAGLVFIICIVLDWTSFTNQTLKSHESIITNRIKETIALLDSRWAKISIIAWRVKTILKKQLTSGKKAKKN